MVRPCPLDNITLDPLVLLIGGSCTHSVNFVRKM